MTNWHLKSINGKELYIRSSLHEILYSFSAIFYGLLNEGLPYHYAPERATLEISRIWSLEFEVVNDHQTY